jgi:hypothetical protein
MFMYLFNHPLAPAYHRPSRLESDDRHYETVLVKAGGKWLFKQRIACAGAK